MTPPRPTPTTVVFVASERLPREFSVLYRGDIVETGPAGPVTSAPEHPCTRRLMLASPVADPAEQAGRRAERHRLAEAERNGSPE